MSHRLWRRKHRNICREKREGNAWVWKRTKGNVCTRRVIDVIECILLWVVCAWCVGEADESQTSPLLGEGLEDCPHDVVSILLSFLIEAKIEKGSNTLHRCLQGNEWGKAWGVRRTDVSARVKFIRQKRKSDSPRSRYHWGVRKHSRERRKHGLEWRERAFSCPFSSRRSSTWLERSLEPPGKIRIELRYRNIYDMNCLQNLRDSLTLISLVFWLPSLRGWVVISKMTKFCRSVVRTPWKNSRHSLSIENHGLLLSATFWTSENFYLSFQSNREQWTGKFHFSPHPQPSHWTSPLTFSTRFLASLSLTFRSW